MQVSVALFVLLAGQLCCAEVPVGEGDSAEVQSQAEIHRSSEEHECDIACLNEQLGRLQQDFKEQQAALQEAQQQLVAQQEEIQSLDEGQTRSIRQCSWVDLFVTMENGEVASCSFHKKRAKTVLRVAWTGNLRMVAPVNGAGCSRWFFTIKGQECQQPAAIDALVYDTDAQNHIFRTTHLEGLCGGIDDGDLDVTFNVGDCINRGSIYGRGNRTQAGWSDTSRIVVEEIDAGDPAEIL